MEPRTDGQPVDVSALITTWNSRDLLRSCLRSIIDKTEGISYEIILVDDLSADGSADMVQREFPQVQLVSTSFNMGFVGANNLGVARATGTYVCLLNSDTVLLNNALRILAAFLDDHRDVGICGAWLKNEDLSSQVSYGAFPSLRQAAVNAFFLHRIFPGAGLPDHAAFPPEDSSQARPIDYVTGAALMVRRSITDELGLFDDRFQAYCEEVDLCYRVRHILAQGVWFVPQAQILHHGGMSYGRMPETRIRLMYSSYNKFLLKHHGTYYALLTRLLYAAHYTLKAAVRSVRFILSTRSTREVRHASLRDALLSIRYSLRPK